MDGAGPVWLRSAIAWLEADTERGVALLRRVLPSGRRGRIVTAALGLSLLVAGLLVVLLSGPDSRHATALPPTPPSPNAPASTGGSGTAAAAKASAAHKPFRCSAPKLSALAGSAPYHICIPGIGVDTVVMQLGLNPDRTVQVPPLSQVGDAGWYRYSTVPGASGPSVILGHVDSAQYGEGVFFQLGNLTDGAKVITSRADGMTATYAINKVSQVPKSEFPTQSVYGPTPGPALRLVIYGGPFDASARSYLDNIIAYGTLLSLKPT